MIFIVAAGGRITTNPELDTVATLFGTDMWHHMTLGIGPQGDSAFVNSYHELFADKVHSAVLRIIDEMRDEVATELLRLAEAEAASHTPPGAGAGSEGIC